MSELDVFDVVVVGAGPAGRAAAARAARAGARVALVDELDPPPSSGPWPLSELAGVRLFARHAVWDIWGERTKHISLVHPDAGSTELQSRAVILAPGDRPRHVPFAGWTLTGVVNLHATSAEALDPRGRADTRDLTELPDLPGRPDAADLRGRRVLLGGSGPGLLRRAWQLLAAGAHLVVVVDSWPWAPLAGVAALALTGRGLSPVDVSRDVVTRAKLQARGVLWLRRHAVSEATGLADAAGTPHVRSVSVCPLRRDGSAIREAARRFEVDTVCLDNGRVPATEIAFGLGADRRFEPRLGAFVAIRDARLRLSVPGTFLAGAGGGAAQGTAWAAAEGSLAGLWAAVELGRLTEPAARREALPIERSLRHWQRLARLATVGQPPPSAADATTDIILCRCEGVTLGDLQRALVDGVQDPNWIKGPTSAAMGRCQGRDCETEIALAVARLRGRSPAQVQPLNVRPPFRPIPLGVVARDVPPPRRVQVIAES